MLIHRRGQYICALLGFAICPWKIQKSAATFLAFLNGYSIFLAPLCASKCSFAAKWFGLKYSNLVILTDYYIVRHKSGYNISQLYTPKGLYWYSHGVNWRAIAAFFAGMLPLLPGLIHQINPEVGGITRGYVNFSSLAWLDSTVLAWWASPSPFNSLIAAKGILVSPITSFSESAPFPRRLIKKMKWHGRSTELRKIRH